MKRLVATTCLITLFAAGAVPAQDTTPMADHSQMTGAMDGFMSVMNKQIESMPKTSSGNVDADFIMMMIPHHQSAIDMAKIELEQGSDAEAKKMAQQIIDAQQKEIKELSAMLERMGMTPPPAN